MSRKEINLEAADTLYHIYQAIGRAIGALEEIETLRADRDEWVRKYNGVISDSIKHSESMMGQLLVATINGKVGGPPSNVDEASQ